MRCSKAGAGLIDHRSTFAPRIDRQTVIAASALAIYRVRGTALIGNRLMQAAHALHPYGSLVAILLSLSGCVSFSYVDDHNNRHVIGFVDVTVQSPQPNQNTATAIVVTSLGLAATVRPETGVRVVLGYTKDTVLLVPNGACIDLTKDGICAGGQRTASTTFKEAAP